MGSEERLAYLDRVNRELARELTRYDMLLTRLRVQISHQKNRLNLLSSLQKEIGSTGSDRDFFKGVADLICNHLQMARTLILEPDINNPGRMSAAEGSGYLDAGSLPDTNTPFILRQNDRNEPWKRNIARMFTLDSIIYFPVIYNGEIKLSIITGRQDIDNTMSQELDEEDLVTMEAVGTLIASYLGRAELVKLAETDRIKTEFVSNLSHEFRTPLTLVLGLLDEMKVSLLPIMDDREREAFQVVYRNASRINELISQLLDISRLETRTEKLRVESIDLAGWLGNLASNFSTLARKKGINFQYTIRGSSSLSWFDPDKLEKIISNLLSNAIKYTPRSGTVELLLILEEENGTTTGRFEVSDTGFGIAPEERENIFKRFYRINGANREEVEGTGVGLYLVKELTEMHRGTIAIDSSPGKGSLFTLRIPLSRDAYSDLLSDENREDEERTPSAKDEPENTNGSIDKPSILIVEDNPDLLAFLTSNLGRMFRVEVARNGREGLDLAREKIPNLVVTDIMMPVMDGAEMTVQLKADQVTSHIPVIMLTARADRQSKLQGLDCGADDYIVKPFDMEELILKVRNHLETAESIRRHSRRLFLEAPAESQGGPLEDRFLQNLSGLMRSNIQNPGFQVEELCRDIGVSRSQLYRKLENLTGLSPAELLRNLRMGTAAAMFREGYTSVSQVMYMVGYGNASHFSRIFRKFYVLSPSDYIKKFTTR